MHTLPKPQISLAQKKELVCDFINNPSEDENSLKDFLSNIIDLAKMRFDLNLEYASQQYCAFSGAQINTQENVVIIDGLTFNQQLLSQYFLRDGILDVSIGDIEFSSFQDGEQKHITIPLTQEVLNSIYGQNLDQLLKDAHTHYSQRLNEPIMFTCKKTGKEHLISDRIKINNEDVCIYWAIQNIHTLKEPERSYVESCKNSFPAAPPTTQSMRLDNINSSQNFSLSQKIDYQQY